MDPGILDPGLLNTGALDQQVLGPAVLDDGRNAGSRAPGSGTEAFLDSEILESRCGEH